MGVKIFDLAQGKEIGLVDLANKKIAIDAYNQLYQFLTTIRQKDGTLLMDSQGNVTSHLSGLFFRSTNLMQKGIKLAFVFDGEAPKLKESERERRSEFKKQAHKKYEEAKQKEDVEEMRKHAARTTKLTSDLVDEAKELIKALGLPVIQAPSEGEAQAAYITTKDDVFAVASQDADCLLFGATRLVRNLGITGRRKKALSYEIVKPEIIELGNVLNKLGVDREQLIVLGMLVGTDYNKGGIKNIGPKKALKLVKQYGKDYDELFKDVKWDDFFKYSWNEVFYLFKKMPTTDDYKLGWDVVDEQRVFEILCEKHDFGRERVENALKRLLKEKDMKKQKGLGEFL